MKNTYKKKPTSDNALLVVILLSYRLEELATAGNYLLAGFIIAIVLKAMMFRKKS